jgi:DNA-binding NarL/FixJ family response regulator
MKTVLYSDDINLLTHWENALEKECEIVDEMQKLYEKESCIVIINYSACLGKCDELLSKLSTKKNRVLILDRAPELQIAKRLLKQGACGYGNALMREHFIVSAVNAIGENMIWLYPEFTSALIREIPRKKTEQSELNLEVLTAREKDVALLLRDGFAYKDIASKLDITPRTVKAHAQQAYTKLHVKDRLALALLLK